MEDNNPILPMLAPSDIDWANETDLMVISGYNEGIPEAVAEVENRPELKEALEERDGKKAAEQSGN